MANAEHIEVYRDQANEWRWRWVAANGRRMATSGEGYQNREDCFEAARHISEAAPPVEMGAPVETLPGEVGERLAAEEAPTAST